MFFTVLCPLTELVPDALNEALSQLTELAKPMTSQIIAVLAKPCCDVLIPVKSIPTQFRAMSNKRMPAEPSHFVSSILKPVKNFFGINGGDGYGARLKDDYMSEYATTIFETVAERCAFLMFTNLF